ncbi:MAG: dephospho-CoA kinase [Fimbriiglobus sp.]
MKAILGLIGAIGAGKSTVASYLAARGGFLVDADKLGHLVIEEPDVKRQVVKRWGDKILAPTGQINRKAVGAIVFANPAEREVLQAIMFPRIQAREYELFAQANLDENIKFIILDAAVLLEAGHGGLCTKILFVDADWSKRVERVKARSGWDEAELRRREESQMPLAEKRAKADAIVTNNGTLDELHAQLDQVLQRWGFTDKGTPRERMTP